MSDAKQRGFQHREAQHREAQHRELHQHDLQPSVAQDLVARASVQRGDCVLEAGPGTGAITAALLAAGAQVHAWELDRDRVRALQQRFRAELASGQLSLHAGDAVGQHPPGRRGCRWRVVANPPFNRTAALMQAWLLSESRPQRIDCLWQYHAAAKWCAPPPAATRSSLLALALGAPAILTRLPRTVTTPPSHVDLCHFSWHARPPTGPAQEPGTPLPVAELFAWWRHCFAGAHSIKEALRGVATPAILKRQGDQHGYRADDHPRVLSLAAWCDLLSFLRQLGRTPPTGTSSATPASQRPGLTPRRKSKRPAKKSSSSVRPGRKRS